MLEIAARLYIPLRGHRLDDVRDQYARRRAKRLAGTWEDRVMDHPYLPYYPKVKAPDVEMRGLRLVTAEAVKPPDVFRIFCLGGSTTYGGYPAKLEAALRDDFPRHGLRLEVVNASDVSWTTAESLIDFEFRCLPYKPDAVIVYHGVNDVWPAFGPAPRTDYAHWRTRLIPNEPMLWDYAPKFFDRSAAFVQLRAWAEGGSQPRTWKRAMMRYVPDFAHDPYHGVEPYRWNMTNLIAVARRQGIPVMLATHVYNADFPGEHYLDALKEINEITRSLAEEEQGVVLVDAATLIRGTDETMSDVCHFRTDRNGEAQLVQLLAAGVRENLASWLQERRPRDAMPGDRTASRGNPSLPRNE